MAVEFALRPADENAIGAALYTLRIMTRGRAQMADADREAEAMIWLEHLGRFPADIVLTTLRNWPTRPNGQWWPVWHEVQKELEAQTSARRLLAEHIRASKCLPEPVAVEPERDESPEGVAKRQAFIDERLARMRQRVEDAKPSGPKDPINPVDAYDQWEARELEKIRAESSKGKYRLSAEAKAAAKLSPDLPIPQSERSEAA